MQHNILHLARMHGIPKVGAISDFEMHLFAHILQIVMKTRSTAIPPVVGCGTKKTNYPVDT